MLEQLELNFEESVSQQSGEGYAKLLSEHKAMEEELMSYEEERQELVSEKRMLELELAGRQSSTDELLTQVDELKGLLRRKEEEFGVMSLEVQGVASQYERLLAQQN